MDSKPNSSSNLSMQTALLLGAACTAVSGALWYFGTGLHPFWVLTWLAPLPLLFLAPRVSGWTAFVTVVCSRALGGLNLWHLFRGELATPLPVILLVLFIPAVFLGLAVLLFRRLVSRGALLAAAVGFPAAWVAYEYLNATSSPHSTFGNLGYTQINCLPVLQIASLTGIWGISFCLFFLAAIVASLIYARTRQQRRNLLAVAALVFAGILGYGVWRLYSTPPTAQSLRIALVAGPGRRFPHDDPAALELLRTYADYTGKAIAGKGAQLVILPEKIAVITDQGTLDADTLFQAAATRFRANVLIGIDRGTQTQRMNEARLYSSDGKLASTYDKHHMIPGFEDMDQPGKTLTTMNQPSGVWGIQICKDLDFPALSRDYGVQRVGLLLVPAWDFGLDGWMHGRMAVMRGVESGFTIARSAKSGVLTISDNRGRILAEQSSTEAPFSSLVAVAPVRNDRTLYVRWGDWFAWLNILAALAVLFVPRRIAAG